MRFFNFKLLFFSFYVDSSEKFFNLISSQIFLPKFKSFYINFPLNSKKLKTNILFESKNLDLNQKFTSS